MDVADCSEVASATAVGEHEKAIRFVLLQAKSLAVEYYRLTGKPLGVTGEVAELEAAEKLGLRLSGARTAYYDATREADERSERFQIKGRAIARDDPYRGRMPSVKCDGGFEYVLLVLLDKTTMDVLEIWQADRLAVAERLAAPGSKARNERLSLGISQFRSIATRVWPAAAPLHAGWPQFETAAPAAQRHGRLSRPATGGLIGTMVAELLMDRSLGYSQIVHRVRLAFPAANTSTKSVASTARDLRKKGVDVPRRGG